MLASKEGHGGDRLASAGWRPACGITDGLDGDIHHEKTDRKLQPTTWNGCMNTINDTNETTTSPGKWKTTFQRIGIDEACPGS